MKRFLKFGLGLLIASFLFVSCSDDDNNAMPNVSENNGIVLENSAIKIITGAELNVVDTDTEDIDIVYTITTVPENGSVAFVSDPATSVVTFTQADLTASKIVYVHDGSQTLTDEFSFSVTDGDNVLTGIFNISIGEKQISKFYVLNEGSTNGSISLIDRNDNVTLNYFEAVNNIALGKFTQSMATNGEFIFIVVTTNSGGGYVEVVNKSDFSHYATIEGFSYPREIAFANGKAYVSNGNGSTGTYPNQVKQNNELYVIDLATMTKTGQIAVGAGPEKMVVSNNKLYVANSGGYSNDDNTVSVIDLDTDEVVNTIEVKYCPKDMVVDVNGDVWVYCGGVPDYSNINYTNAGISHISESTDAVNSFPLSSIATIGLKNIAINKAKDIVYFMSDAVYAMNIADTALPTTELIDATFYGMDVNPQNDNLWLCKGTNPGKVLVYTSNGEKIKELTVGTFPNSTMFIY